MIKKYNKKWVKALRSRYYAQTDGRLHDDVGYCCLGVLANIVKKEVHGRWEQNEEDESFYFIVEGQAEAAESELFPKPLIQLVGFTNDNPYVTDKNGNPTTLADLNDTGGLSFREIADIIEEQL